MKNKTKKDTYKMLVKVILKSEDAYDQAREENGIHDKIGKLLQNEGYSFVIAGEDALRKEEIKFSILCRKCKQKMYRPSNLVLAFYCKKCEVKAEIRYSKTPTVHAINKKVKE